MDLKEVRNIPISGYLAKLGYHPTKIKGYNYFYPAFWRGGTHPHHVKVDTAKNVWHDYVEGVGGDIIRLCARIHNISDGAAIRMLLQEEEQTKPYVVADVAKCDTPTSGITILEVKDLYYYPLFNYLKERGISQDVGKAYLKEIWFSTSKMTKCFAVAFLNMSGGYVIRNRAFKGCTGQDISLCAAPGSSSYIVFEGVFDFLSFVEEFGTPKINAIVLNSVANIRRAFPLLDGASNIYLCLDNDQSGDTHTAELLARYPHAADKRYHFQDYKDYNDYLISKKNG